VVLVWCVSDRWDGLVLCVCVRDVRDVWCVVWENSECLRRDFDVDAACLLCAEIDSVVAVQTDGA
jgi:hypothetical protein